MSFEVNRRLVARRPPLPSSATVDPVTASIIRGAFETICFEVATHLGRCASSAIINQSNERNASVIDAHGRLAGISVGIPQLLFISPLTVRYGLEHRQHDDWGPGDVLVGNDPEHGGGHLPDYNVYAPVFDERGERRRDAIELLTRNNRMASFAGDLAAMISAVELGVRLHHELIAKYGADGVRAAINWNIAETERRFRA